MRVLVVVTQSKVAQEQTRRILWVATVEGPPTRAHRGRPPSVSCCWERPAHECVPAAELAPRPGLASAAGLVRRGAQARQHSRPAPTSSRCSVDCSGVASLGGSGRRSRPSRAPSSIGEYLWCCCCALRAAITRASTEPSPATSAASNASACCSAPAAVFPGRLVGVGGVAGRSSCCSSSRPAPAPASSGGL